MNSIESCDLYIIDLGSVSVTVNLNISLYYVLVLRIVHIMCINEV